MIRLRDYPIKASPSASERRAVRGQLVESIWSPNHSARRFGVHLASNLGGLKPFVFSEGCL